MRHYMGQFTDYVKMIERDDLWLMEPPTIKNKNGKRILDAWRNLIGVVKSL